MHGPPADRKSCAARALRRPLPVLGGAVAGSVSARAGRKHLLLLVTDGCAGLAAAIQTVYPRTAHQRCWVHKMRNILENVRKRDYDEVKRGAQKIYAAKAGPGAGRLSPLSAGAGGRRIGPHGAATGARPPGVVVILRLPRHLWRKLRTTNIIERCFVEVRRRTRPMVCFVNVQSVERIIYSIFQRFNLGMENPHPQRIYTGSLTLPPLHLVVFVAS